MTSPDNLTPEQVVKDYKGLVLSIARSYLRSGVPLDDLVQDGMMGLLEAVKRYDSSRQVKFSTYAVFWVKKYILRSVEQEYHSGMQTVELDEKSANQLPDKSPLPDSASAIEVGKLILPNDMPPLEAQILRLSFEQQKTIKEISLKLNITSEKVKQLRQKAMRRIKTTK